MLRPQDPLRNHWTSIKNFFVDAPLILPKLVRPSVRHSRADVRFAYVLVLLFLGSSFDTAHAWNAYNNTQFDVNFKVRNIPGDDICTPWTAEEGVIIEAGENTTSEFRSNPAPSWKSENCNPTGERDARLDFVILGRQDNDASATDLSEKKGRFRCDVKGNAGGWVTVYEQPRPGFDDNGNIRPNIYCVSFYKKDNGQQVVIDRSDAFAASRVDLLDPMTLGNRDIRFLITGDPQYWEKDGTTDNIGVNKTADKLLDRMLSIYENSHLRTRGIIISGDLTQDSKNNELTKYKNKIEKSGFRITTTRVYEGLGNHDSVGGTVAGDAIPEEIAKYVGQKARNTFPTSRNLEGHDTFPNYSWEWHDVHFVQLNLFPGDNPGVDPSGNDIEPNNALTFLKDDLANNVGSTNRPIILIHHYGFDSFGLQWWSTDQREAYWNAIKDYNVIAIFVGHAHLTTDTDHDDDWYGTGTELDKPSNADARADGRTEIPVFNAAAARGGDTSAETCESDTNGDPISTACDNGVFLDVTIDSCNNLVVQRKNDNGDLVGESSGAPEKDYRQTITFTTDHVDGTPYGLGQLDPACINVPPKANCVPDMVVTGTRRDSGICHNNEFTIDDGTSVGSCTQSPRNIEVGATETVTLTCTTFQGSASCTTEVEVKDLDAPIITTCDLPGGTYECGEALPDYFIPMTSDLNGNPRAFEVCTIPTDLGVTCTPANGTTLSTSDSLVECIVTDAAGNSDMCQDVLNVVDTLDPKIVTEAPRYQRTCERDGQNPANLTPPVVSDQCDANLTITNDAPTKLPEDQSTIITWTITDDANHSITTTSLAEVIDNHSPQLVGEPQDQHFACTGILTPASDVPLTPPTFTDDCDDDLDFTSTAPEAYRVDDYNIGWTAIDNTGRTSRTIFAKVSITDSNAPQLGTPPGNLTVQCGGGSPANTTVDLTTVAPTATDLCDATVAISPTLPTWQLGNNTVPWTLADDSGNELTPKPTSTVTIDDTTAPTVVSGPGNTTVECSGGSPANTPVTLVPPVASDTCDSAPTISHNAPTSFPLGSTQIAWTIADLTGNQVTPKPTSTVLLQDTLAPTLQTPAPDVLVACIGGPENTPITLVPPVASDSCDTSLTVSNNAPATYPLGSTQINWTIQDDSGHVAPNSSIVTITDTQIPAIQCPQDITVQPTSSTGTSVVVNATATDECRLVSVQCAQSGNTFPVGTTTAVECEAVDLGGNRNACTLNVTVLSEEEVAQAMQDTILVLGTTGVLSDKDEEKTTKDAKKILDRIAEGDIEGACAKTQKILGHFVEGVADGTYVATDVDEIITSSTNLSTTLGCQ